MMDPTELLNESTAENANGGVQIFEKLHEGNITADVSGEYILPDYMPPVEKLLRVQARPVIDEKYCNGEKITLGGHICWEVLYLSSDGEIKSFETEVRFAENCTIHRLDDNCMPSFLPTKNVLALSVRIDSDSCYPTRCDATHCNGKRIGSTDRTD